MLLGISLLGAALLGGNSFAPLSSDTVTPPIDTPATGGSTEDWIVPTESGCRAYLAAAGCSALTSAALGTGQTDPFDEVMPAVVAEIRGFITACPVNVLSATANSVPRQLERTAYLLIIEALQGRLPGVNLTKGQTEALEKCREILQMVAECKYAIANPTNPAVDNVQHGAPARVVTSSRRDVTREKMNGLC